jgi:HAD superfamily hydrolase (TIGR01484 family)
MRYLALVTDYDGTIASDGKIAEAAVASIERLRLSGRRAILVTGRRLADLLAILPYIRLFDYVVAENGAVVYEPRTRQETERQPDRSHQRPRCAPASSLRGRAFKRRNDRR